MSSALKIMPAALALRDFRDPQSGAAEARQPQEPSSTPRAHPRPDMKKLLRAAYLMGRRKEARAAQARLQEALKTLDATHAARLREERARWQEETTGRLAEQLRRELGRMEDRLRATLAQALVPVLEEAVRAHAVAAFAEELRRLLAEAAGTAIEVTGPPAMLAALERELGEELAGLLRAVSDPARAELSLSIDEGVLTTRISEWARKHLPEKDA